MIQDSNNALNETVFEYPVKEQLRGFLRLESLYTQFQYNCRQSNQHSHRHALKLFFEILEILERGDTRAELIKELARLSDVFTRLSQNPGVDTAKLENFLAQIKKLHQWVLAYQGKFGDKLRKDPFLESVRRRSAIPGGTCSFDCPDLFIFLNKPAKSRQARLLNWLEDIQGVFTSIEVILRIIRDSGKWQPTCAPLGSYLIESHEQGLQLIRVRLSSPEELFPEFSCGKHRSNVHFMYFNGLHKKVPLKREVEFELACCY